MPTQCDTDSPEFQANEAKRKAQEAKKEKNLLNGLKAIQAVTEAAAVMSEEYYDEMFKRMDKAEKEHKNDDNQNHQQNEKVKKSFEELTKSQDNTTNTLNLLSIKMGTLTTLMDKAVKGMNVEGKVTEIKDIATRRDNLLTDLHNQRDDLLIDMWMTQTDQMEVIKDILTENALANMEMVESLMGNVAKQLPEKSEISQERREQQRRDMIMQAERDKDRAIFVDMRNLLEDISKKQFGGGDGDGSGGGGGIMSMLMGLFSRFGKFVFGFFGRLGAGIFKWARFLGGKIFGYIGAGFGKLFAGLKIAGGALFNGLKATGGFIFNSFKNVFAGLGNIAGKVMGMFKGGFTTALGWLRGALGGLLTKGGALLGMGGKALGMAAKLAMNPAVLAIGAAVVAGKAIANSINKTTDMMEEARQGANQAHTDMMANTQKLRVKAREKKEDLGDKFKAVFNMRTGEVNAEEFKKLSPKDQKSLSEFMKLKTREVRLRGGAQRNLIEESRELGDKASVRAGENNLKKMNEIINRYAGAEAKIKALEAERAKKLQEEERQRMERIKMEIEKNRINVPNREKTDKIISQTQEITKTEMEIKQQQQKLSEDEKKGLSLVEKQKEEKKDMQAEELLVAIKDVAHHTKVTADKQEVNIVTPPTTRPVNQKVKTMH